MSGRRDEETREVIACHVDEIRVNPEHKTGEMMLKAAAFPLFEAVQKECDHSDEMS